MKLGLNERPVAISKKHLPIYSGITGMDSPEASASFTFSYTQQLQHKILCYQYNDFFLPYEPPLIVNSYYTIKKLICQVKKPLTNNKKYGIITVSAGEGESNYIE